MTKQMASPVSEIRVVMTVHDFNVSFCSYQDNDLPANSVNLKHKIKTAF